MNFVAIFKGEVTTLSIPYKINKEQTDYPNFLARVIIKDVSNSDPSLAQNPIALRPIYFNKMRLSHIHILFPLYLDSFV